MKLWRLWNVERLMQAPSIPHQWSSFIFTKTTQYKYNTLVYTGLTSTWSVAARILALLCFLLLINTFLLVFVNDFFQLEVNPVQMHLLYFYLAVLVNLKLDYCRTIHIILILFNQYSTTIKSNFEGKSKNISTALKTGTLLNGLGYQISYYMPFKLYFLT